MPTLAAAYTKLQPRGFDVIHVVLDKASEREKVAAFLAQNRIPGRHVYDGEGWRGPVAARFGVRSLPYSVLIGRDGKVAAVNPRGAALEEAVAAALIGKPFAQTQPQPQPAVVSAVPDIELLETPGDPVATRAGGPATPPRTTEPAVLAVNAADGAGTPSRRGTHSFGQASLLDAPTVTQNFRVKNDGLAPVTLQRLQTPTGVSAEPLRAPGGSPQTVLEPGQEVVVQVTADLAQLPVGPIQKTVSVYVEGQAAPAAQLEITGTLLPSVDFSPAVLNFAEVTAGQAHPLTLEARYDARLAASGGGLPPLVSDNPAVRIRAVAADVPPSPSPASGDTLRVQTYEVVLDKDAPIGLLLGNLSFAPGAPAATGASAHDAAAVPAALRSAKVVVAAQVVGALSADPQVLAFDAPKEPAGAVEREVVLTARSAAALKNLKVSSGSRWLAVKQAAPSRLTPLQRVVTVTLRPGAPSGLLRTELTVTLANKQRLVVPVNVYVKP